MENGTPAQSRTENLTLEESCDNPFHHGSINYLISMIGTEVYSEAVKLLETLASLSKPMVFRPHTRLSTHT